MDSNFRPEKIFFRPKYTNEFFIGEGLFLHFFSPITYFVRVIHFFTMENEITRKSILRRKKLPLHLLHHLCQQSAELYNCSIFIHGSEIDIYRKLLSSNNLVCDVIASHIETIITYYIKCEKSTIQFYQTTFVDHEPFIPAKVKRGWKYLKDF
jgi:hypothetical protein